MTKFVPHTEPDFDTTADGLSVAFRDRGGQHHALVTAQTNPLTGGIKVSSAGDDVPTGQISEYYRAFVPGDQGAGNALDLKIGRASCRERV